MAQQIIGVGAAANDRTGDTWRAAMIKANDNFTELYAVKTDDIVVLKSEADLPASTLVGGVNTHVLENKQYLINNDFSIADPIGFPGAGNMATLTAVNRAVLTYTGVNSMFRDTDAQGNIEIFGLTEFQAPSGNMFNLTAITSSFSFQAFGPVKFTNCNSLGTVKGNGASGWGVFFGTLSDFDSGLVAEDMAFFECNTMFVFGNNIAGNKYFTLQGSNWAGSVNFWENTFGIPSNVTVFDFKTTIQTGVDSINIRSNQQEGGIVGSIFAGSSLTEKDNKVLANANQILDDTRQGGMLYMVSNATNTVITTISTPVKVAGTWTVHSVSHFSGTTGGRLTYTDARTITTDIDVSLSMDPVSGTNKSLKAYIYKNGVKEVGSGKSILTDSGDPINISLPWKTTMATNDYIEVFVENNTGTTDILVRDIVLRIP